MTLSNGIYLPDLNQFEWAADGGYDRALQNRDTMRTASTASGTVVDPESCTRQHSYPSSRIENIVIVRKADTPNNFGQKGYLRFENVTMVCLHLCFGISLMLTPIKCPMHKNLIDVDLLEAPEKAWVNAYHQEVFVKVSPLLAHDTRALEWLKRETSPL